VSRPCTHFKIIFRYDV